MTEVQVRILEMFKRLAPAEQSELLAELDATRANYEGFTASEILALDEGVAQAERGDTLAAANVFARPSARFDFHNK
jgi:hypothetical protein